MRKGYITSKDDKYLSIIKPLYNLSRKIYKNGAFYHSIIGHNFLPPHFGINAVAPRLSSGFESDIVIVQYSRQLDRLDSVALRQPEWMDMVMDFGQDKPTNLTAAKGLLAAGNGHSYTFGFANYHGAAIPRPGLAKFLFDCEFGLFGQVPASGLGVWTPYPQGKYICNGNLPGMVRMNLVDNTVGWKMAYHDLAFLIKVLHDTEGVKDEAPFFDFVFNYTDELDSTPYQRIVNGEWVKTYSGTAATSAQ